MKAIYNQFDTAFNRVSAFIVMKPEQREPVAKIAFKFPADGAGRLYCYLHFPGNEMTRGFAGGYGYDKRTAAAADAACKTPPIANEDQEAARKVLMVDGGDCFDSALRKAGFDIFQAV